MADPGARFVMAVIALALMFGALATLLFLARGPWWPSLIFQAGRRPQLFWTWLAASFALLFLLGATLAGGAGIAFAALAWLVLAPRIIGPVASRIAWKRDRRLAKDKVTAALAIRNRIRRARDESELADGLFWAEYVLDNARAEIQARYKPPGDPPPPA
jgi:Na+-transporting methylmalonyl-CoA/oxaloacetate decarboxylase gamma subunit